MDYTVILQMYTHIYLLTFQTNVLIFVTLSMTTEGHYFLSICGLLIPCVNLLQKMTLGLSWTGPAYPILGVI